MNFTCYHIHSHTCAHTCIHASHKSSLRVVTKLPWLVNNVLNISQDLAAHKCRACFCFIRFTSDSIIPKVNIILTYAFSAPPIYRKVINSDNMSHNRFHSQNTKTASFFLLSCLRTRNFFFALVLKDRPILDFLQFNCHYQFDCEMTPLFSETTKRCSIWNWGGVKKFALINKLTWNFNINIYFLSTSHCYTFPQFVKSQKMFRLSGWKENQGKITIRAALHF